MGEAIIAVVALTAMEIVLGIDNIVFIAIVSARLPEAQRPKARQLGLLAALVMRIILLFTISLVMKADQPLFYWSDILGGEEVEQVDSNEADPSPGATGDDPANPDADEDGDAEDDHGHSADDNEHGPAGVSIKDLILLVGGLFLIWKSVFEIHEKIEHDPSEHDEKPVVVTFSGVIFQVMMLDMIFSIDSVITAVGMIKSDIPITSDFSLPGIALMVTAVLISMGVMLAFANPISNFVERHPTIKMLALSFLILIGVMLVAEGAGTHFDKGYVYFAMAFALIVEMLNLRVRMISRKPSEKKAAEKKSQQVVSKGE